MWAGCLLRLFSVRSNTASTEGVLFALDGVEGVGVSESRVLWWSNLKPPSLQTDQLEENLFFLSREKARDSNISSNLRSSNG